jgi:CheY-like chemotaxis protein
LNTITTPDAEVVKSIQDCIESVDDAVINMKSITSFMLMTINRVLDFTKASKGMQLVAKNETINLFDTLQMPLNCMRGIQTRIEIKVLPMSKSICSHIITDSLWFQENILCLLSNAVKYTTSGEVKIKVSVICESDVIISAENNIDTNSTSSSLSSKNSNLVTFRGLNRHPKSSRLIRRNSYVNVNNNNNNNNKVYPLPDEIKMNGHKNIGSELLLIQIEDSGIGIADDKIDNLFAPFQQAQRFAGGTGLGLYSLGKRVDALNGYYGVRHRYDNIQGSVFWFAIPYRPDIQINDCNKTGYNSLKLIEEDDVINNILSEKRKKLTILLVDDSPSILKMTGMMFRKQGYLVTEAINGHDALNKINEKKEISDTKFDVIVMDIQMPVMDGLECTRRLRILEKQYMLTNQHINNNNNDINDNNNNNNDNNNNIYNPHNKVICCSANGDEETVAAALNEGADGFINKPLTIKKFEEIIKSFGLL